MSLLFDDVMLTPRPVCSAGSAQAADQTPCPLLKPFALYEFDEIHQQSTQNLADKIVSLWASLAWSMAASNKLPRLRSMTPAAVCAFLFSLSFALVPTYAGPRKQNPIVVDDPDLEVKEFRLADLQDRLRTMPPGAERDYFAGVLANWQGRTEESIRLLNTALPSIRKSQAARAAVALQTLADDYNKAFRYRDAARAYDDL
jgi:hypothetical protein